MGEKLGMGVVRAKAAAARTMEEAGPPPSSRLPANCEDDERLKAELEFVQLLANPQYLNYLAQNNYFSDPAFVSYLEYLKYWQSPRYAKLVIFPQCLYFLELLQTKEFRDLLLNGTVVEWLHHQQYYYWCNKSAKPVSNNNPQHTTETGTTGGN